MPTIDANLYPISTFKQTWLFNKSRENDQIRLNNNHSSCKLRRIIGINKWKYFLFSFSFPFFPSSCAHKHVLIGDWVEDFSPNTMSISETATMVQSFHIGSRVANGTVPGRNHTGPEPEPIFKQRFQFRLQFWLGTYFVGSKPVSERKAQIRNRST